MVLWVAVVAAFSSSSSVSSSFVETKSWLRMSLISMSLRSVVSCSHPAVLAVEWWSVVSMSWFDRVRVRLSEFRSLFILGGGRLSVLVVHVLEWFS